MHYNLLTLCITSAKLGPPHKITQQDKVAKPDKKPTRSTTKKTNTGAGHDLGVGEGEEVRVEDVVRGQDEETQGETQTTWVWVSPAPERKKTEKRRRRTYQTKRKKRDTDNNPNTGRGLKGETTNNIPTSEKNNRNIKAENDLNNLTTNWHRPLQSPRGMFIAGWLGPWAALYS